MFLKFIKRVYKYFHSMLNERIDLYYRNLAERGKKEMGLDIDKYFVKIHGSKAEGIILIGKFNIVEFQVAKNELQLGQYKTKILPTNLNDDVILVFQIYSLGEYFVLAVFDSFDFETPNKYIWFQKIDFPIVEKNQALIYL